jgi:hypothetical protein
VDYFVPLTLRFRKSKKTNRWAVSVIEQPLPGSPHQGEPDVIEEYMLHVLSAVSAPAPVVLAAITPTPSSLSLTVGTAPTTLTFLATDTLGRPVTNASFQVTVSDPAVFTSNLAVVFTDSQGIGTLIIDPISAGTGETLTIEKDGIDADVTVDVATAPVVFDSIVATPDMITLDEGGVAGNISVSALDDQARPFAGTFDLESTTPATATVPATVVTNSAGQGSFAITPVAEGTTTINIKIGVTTHETVAVTVGPPVGGGANALEDLEVDIEALGGERIAWYDEQYGVTGDPASSWADGISAGLAISSPGTATARASRPRSGPRASSSPMSGRSSRPTAAATSKSRTARARASRSSVTRGLSRPSSIWAPPSPKPRSRG